ncbi:MAG: NAD-binding protein, partial [Lysinibacillus sp.]
MKKEFVVIGLGRFGGSIVRELMDQDAQVMAIDNSSERVDEFASI